MHRLDGRQIAFPTTDWSKLDPRIADESARKAQLEEVLNRYLPAMRAYLRAVQGYEAADAEDFVQSFVLDKFIAGDFLSRADRSRGRFRSFLIKSLNNYVSNQLRSARPLAVGGDFDALISRRRRSGDADPTHRFDAVWARRVLFEAIRRTKRRCERSGRMDVWQVLYERVILCCLRRVSPPSYGDLVTRHGFDSPRQACNVLVTGKRLFSKTLREIVAEYVIDHTLVEDEIRELGLIVSRNGKSAL